MIPLILRRHRGQHSHLQHHAQIYGLMNRVIEEAAESGYRIFKWCVLDVLEKCVDRDCETCGLWEDCGGKARQASGFYRIDDAIDHKRKVSRETWRRRCSVISPARRG